jgi:hypothetical protein
MLSIARLPQQIKLKHFKGSSKAFEDFLKTTVDFPLAIIFLPSQSVLILKIVPCTHARLPFKKVFVIEGKVHAKGGKLVRINSSVLYLPIFISIKIDLSACIK